ncbi:MAG TPA: hypothetical protein ACFCUY_13960 [Xenococcaceae cyanobacterium]
MISRINPLSIEFDRLFVQEPQIAANISTYDGSDSAGLRYDNLSATGVDIKIEEEKSLDNEISHTTEIVDFLLIEGSGSLSATPIAPLSSNGFLSTDEILSSQLDDFFWEVTEG